MSTEQLKRLTEAIESGQIKPFLCIKCKRIRLTDGPEPVAECTCGRLLWSPVDKKKAVHLLTRAASSV